ncbi:MAG: hypothetical protein IT453_19470, partial [Planctomycetes bacterium]|nr:hypothetical protein [Planctomycetota bacterium]
MSSRVVRGVVAWIGGFVVAVLAATASAKGRVQVFVLAGQSNMEGPAVLDVAREWNRADYNDGRGTLAEVMRVPANAARYAHLKDANGAWTVR